MAESGKLTTITVPFSGGIDARTQLEALDPTQGLVVATNVRADKRGALTKRHGFEVLSQDSNTHTGEHLFAWKDGLPAYVGSADGGKTFQPRWRHRNSSVMQTTKAAPGGSVTRVSEVVASRYPVSTARAEQYVSNSTYVPTDSTDCCELGPYQVTSSAYRVGGVSTCELTVSDGPIVLGRIVVPGSISPSNVRLVTMAPHPTTGLRQCGVVINATGSDGISVRVLTIDADENLTISAATLLLAFGASNTGQWWDAAPCDGGIMAVVRKPVTGYDVVHVSPALADVVRYDSVFADCGSVTCAAFGTGPTLTRYVFCHSTSAGFRIERRTAAGAMLGQGLSANPLTQPDALAIVALGTGDALCTVNYTKISSLGSPGLPPEGAAVWHIVNMTNAGRRGFVTAGFMSRPVVRDGIAYVMAQANVEPFREAYGIDGIAVLVELWRADGAVNARALRPVASVAPRLASVRQSRLSNVLSLSDRILAPVQVGVSQVSASVQFASFLFGRGRVWQSHQSTGCQYFAGGLVEKFDGTIVREAVFLHRPLLVLVDSSAAGTLTGGPYVYAAVYEDVDSQGNLEQSALSRPLVVASVTSKRIDVHLSPLTLTQRSPTARVALYRTTAGGNVFYRIATFSAYAAAPIAYSDQTADTVIVSSQILYKGLGVPGDFVDHSAPPGLFPTCLHQNRLVGAGDDGTTLWGSNEVVQGEALYWSELFTQVAAEGGPITGLASQDGVLYIFKRAAIFAMSGEGPTENGMGGWSLQRIPSDVGCIEALSVATTPDGVWFRSERGLELLARGGSVTWVGEPLGDTLIDDDDLPMVCRGATVDPAKGLVIWAMQANDGSGLSVIYDQNVRAWFTDVVVYGESANDAATSTAMVSVPGVQTARYARLQAEGAVLYESDFWRDPTPIDAGWITTTIETGWVRLAGMVGEHEVPAVYLLARHNGPHGIEVRAAYDYRGVDLAGTPMRSYTSTQVASILDGKQAYRLGLQTDNNARGTAVRIRFQDRPPVDWPAPGYGSSASFVGLVFEGQAKASHSPHATRER